MLTEDKTSVSDFYSAAGKSAVLIISPFWSIQRTETPLCDSAKAFPSSSGILNIAVESASESAAESEITVTDKNSFSGKRVSESIM